MKRTTSLLILLLLPISMLLAQGSHTIDPQSTLVVKGTSSLHDWSMQSEALQGEMVLESKAGKISKINNLKVTLAAKSLKSGKKAMDSNTYEALKADQHPTIQFELGTIKSLVHQVGGSRIVAVGTVTIAGVTRPETIEVNAQADAKGNIRLEGKKVIKMSDYKVEAPSFMFGKFTTGDAVTIDINLKLVPNPLNTQN